MQGDGGRSADGLQRERARQNEPDKVPRGPVTGLDRATATASFDEKLGGAAGEAGKLCWSRRVVGLWLVGIEGSAGGGGVVIQEVLGGWPGLQFEEGDRLDGWIRRRS